MRRKRVNRFRPPWSRAIGLLWVTLLLSSVDAKAGTQQRQDSADLLRELSSSSESLVRRVSPSVVQIATVGYGTVEEPSGSQTALVTRQRTIGSGVIIDPDGYIITNAHVVGGAQRVRVVLTSPSAAAESAAALISTERKTLDANIVGLDTDLDLALLKVEATGLPALTIRSHNRIRQGELVFAFGSPEGLQNSVTMGVISSVARQPDPDKPMVYIQTDAPINPGNSGGPLVDVDGNLVGINTFILTQSGGSEGLGFAIPSGVVNFVYKQLRKYGHVHRGEIGASVQTITPILASGLGLPRNHGVIVSDVSPDGPADQAGLKIQDIILSLDDQPVETVLQFDRAIYLHNKDEQAKLEVLRGEEKRQLLVQVIEHEHDVDRVLDIVDPAKDLVPKLGILGLQIDAEISKMFPELRRGSGVIVVARAATSGPESGLQSGDVIHSVNGVTVIGLDGLRAIVDKLKPNEPVAMQIERQGKLSYLAFEME
jgi:serine protease Do